MPFTLKLLHECRKNVLETKKHLFAFFFFFSFYHILLFFWYVCVCLSAPPMKSRFPGGHVWHSYVHTCRRGINTCADRTGQPPVTADTDTPSGKLCSMLQAKTQTALHSSFRNSARTPRPQPGVLNMDCVQSTRGLCMFAFILIFV